VPGAAAGAVAPRTSKGADAAAVTEAERKRRRFMAKVKDVSVRAQGARPGEAK
jgi:hypothetical protein